MILCHNHLSSIVDYWLGAIDILTWNFSGRAISHIDQSYQADLSDKSLIDVGRKYKQLNIWWFQVPSRVLGWVSVRPYMSVRFFCIWRPSTSLFWGQIPPIYPFFLVLQFPDVTGSCVRCVMCARCARWAFMRFLWKDVVHIIQVDRVCVCVKLV